MLERTTTAPLATSHRWSYRERAMPACCLPGGEMQHIQAQIEERLAERAPDVEVLLVEVVGDTVRLFIDHPDGVTLELCEQVTHMLPEVREEHALEVSSPGLQRPLTKPDHFRRFLGRRARVRTRAEHSGKTSFTGAPAGASAAAAPTPARTGLGAIRSGQL